MEGVDHGYWDFRRSWLLRTVLPWTLLLDAALASVINVYIPLMRGQTVVCERFVLDMIVDLAVACDDCRLHNRPPGRYYPRLLPRGTTLVILALDAKTIRERRPDLCSDRRLQARLDMFESLSADLSLPVLASKMHPDELNERILGMMDVASTGQMKSSRENKYASKFRFRPIRWLLGHAPIGLAVHWTFQGMLYMDKFERRFKLGVDIFLTSGCWLLLCLWTPWRISLPIAFFIAHTLNFVLNSQPWVVLKHYGCVRNTREEFIDYLKGFHQRCECEPSITHVRVYGSISRRQWSPTSDIDARILRAAGFVNGLRACWFLLRERTRATVAKFPLDAYLIDDEAMLLRMDPRELPIDLYDVIKNP